MAVYLWVFWRYVGGWGWPKSTATARRELRRANPLTPTAWAAALFAGTIGLAALVAALRVVNRLASLPAEPPPDLTRVPILTLVLALAMGAIVAGVAEETAFRGYMQGPIERRHGPVVAILVTGLVFGVAHMTHSYVSWALMPYYLAVAAVYGALAYLTNSILPSLVLHALGNMLGYVELLNGGRAEWQAPPRPAPPVWTSGPDAAFWQTLAVTLVLAGAAVAAYLNLRRVVRSTPSHQSVAPA